MDKFAGDFAELKAIVDGLNSPGEWAEEVNKRVFRSEDGAVLNWWPSTGTLQFQGTMEPRQRLKDAVTRALSSADSALAVTDDYVEANSTANLPTSTKPELSASEGQSKQVFVVHGHDDVAREQLELILHRLGLQPFVLANTSGDGLTIIEALEREIGSESRGRKFGIVLLTPDDKGCESDAFPESAEPRARQNVVMEMGMLITAFGRERVAILKKGHVVVPSDASGIIYLPFNSHVKEVAPKLCERLRKAEFDISPEAITEASA